MFKEASKLKLRFATTRGSLTVEQLWDLPLNELDALAVGLEDLYESSKGKSFLTKKSLKDKTIKLQFDVVLDILQTKAEAEDAARSARENKENDNKILALIAEKKEGDLKGKSIEELEAMLSTK